MPKAMKSLLQCLRIIFPVLKITASSSGWYYKVRCLLRRDESSRSAQIKISLLSLPIIPRPEEFSHHELRRTMRATNCVLTPGRWLKAKNVVLQVNSDARTLHSRIGSKAWITCKIGWRQLNLICIEEILRLKLFA